MAKPRGSETSHSGSSAHPAPPFDAWQWMQACTETWAGGLDPAGTGQRLRERRLATLIESTLRDSPFYRQRSPQARCLADFAPVTKLELMGDFDRWAVDRRVSRRGVEVFIGDPNRVADAWLERYLVWTSSGTSGHPGVFVQDSASLAAYDAIDAFRLRGAAPHRAALGLWGLGRSFAFVGATGGHFAGHAGFERLRRIVPPGLAPRMTVISVLDPMTRIAERLQAFQPDVLITYPSCAAALAQMQMDASLHIAPAEIWLGGEQVSAAQRAVLQQAFGGALRNAYGASEFPSIAFECEHGRLHVNDDWVVLEAVDARLRPVAAGEMSHTTLLTNLANRAQPLLRYRLDDCIRFVPEPCACGSAFPVIEVRGRADDTLHLPGRRMRRVTLLPLALETAIEEGAGVTRFQLLCSPQGKLALHLEPGVPDAEAALARCRSALTAFLDRHGVDRACLTACTLAPLRQRASGKLRRVIETAPVAGRRARRPPEA